MFRWLALAGTAAFLIAVGGGLAAEFRALPLVDLAWAVETAKAPVETSEDADRRISDAVLTASGCEETLARSRVTAALFLFRRSVDAEAPEDVRAERLLFAQATVREALACNPSDGNLWFLMAELERLVAFEPERTAALLAMSARTAPFEARTLLDRWRLLASLPSVPGRGHIADRFEPDLVRALSVTRPADAAEIRQRLQGDANLASLSERALAQLEPARRESLLAQGKDTRRPGRADRFRTFDLSPLTGAAAPDGAPRP